MNFMNVKCVKSYYCEGIGAILPKTKTVEKLNIIINFPPFHPFKGVLTSAAGRDEI